MKNSPIARQFSDSKAGGLNTLYHIRYGSACKKRKQCDVGARENKNGKETSAWGCLPSPFVVKLFALP